MPIAVALVCIAALFVVAVCAVAFARSPQGTPLVYSAALAISLVALAAALTHLLSGGSVIVARFPFGLPTLGAHFRLDALSPSSWW